VIRSYGVLVDIAQYSIKMINDVTQVDLYSQGNIVSRCSMAVLTAMGAVEIMLTLVILEM
jgi:hypothetical protein